MTGTQQQPQMLDPDTAYAMVHQRVYAPVFFSKLAQDYGIKPQSEQEAMEMLAMAGQLRSAHDQGATKQASNGLLSAAREHLNNALASEGFASHDAHNDRLVKRAAAEIAAEPHIANAILSLQAQAAAALADDDQ